MINAEGNTRVAQLHRLKNVSKIWRITRNDDSGTYCINRNSASKIRRINRNNDGGTYCINRNSASEIRCINRNNDSGTCYINRNSASETRCISRNNDSGGYRINGNSASEVRCINPIPRRKSQNGNLFCSYYYYYHHQLAELRKKSVRKFVGAKRNMGKFRHRMEDVKMHLKSRVAIGFNCHALIKMVMNFQAQ